MKTSTKPLIAAAAAIFPSAAFAAADQQADRTKIEPVPSETGFRKQDNGNWKIARYSFSTTNPPRQ